MNPEIPNEGSSTNTSGNLPPQDSSQSTTLEGEQANKGTLDALSQYIERVEKFERRLTEDENKIEESKNQNIETLGLFVALFTFISVEFSLFNDIKDFNSIISLTFIIAGLLAFFVLLLYNVVRTANSNRWWLIYSILFLVAMSFVGTGIYFQLRKDKALINTQPSATSSATLMPTTSPRP